MLAVVRQSQNFHPAADPFPGAQDGQNLISWRCSLPSPTDRVWWKSMHTISSYHGNRPTHTHTATNPQTGPIPIHCAAKLSTQCNTLLTVRSLLETFLRSRSWLSKSDHTVQSNEHCLTEPGVCNLSCFIVFHGKGELVQSFCGQMPFLSPTSRNHSLDLIFSLTAKTPEQGKGRHSLCVGSLDASTSNVVWCGRLKELDREDARKRPGAIVLRMTWKV